MKELKKDWEGYKAMLQTYFDRSANRRAGFVFRGQGDATWELKSTIDRKHTFASDEKRLEVISDLVQEFKRQALGVDGALSGGSDDLEWELLGRHHGLPTPVIDWTQSPFVAAYFAFDDPAIGESDEVAIWILNLGDFIAESLRTEVSVINQDDFIRANRRAIRQRGVFLRVESVAEPVESIMADYLYKVILPAHDHERALAELDEMTITAPRLFNDLEYAARSSERRVFASDQQRDGELHVR